MAKEKLDNFLLAELKSGNTRAFDRIFHDQYASLCRFSNAIIHDHDKAQSLVQGVFVKLWETRDRLEHVNNIPAYLTTMVKNTSVNYIRNEKKHIHLPDLPDDATEDSNADQHLGEIDLAEKLVLSVNSLPARCREAFEFSRYQNLSNKEISERMQITQKSVEALITRALRSLRTELADYLPSARQKKWQGKLLFLLVRKITRKNI